jgi:hypothetical protein
LGRGEGGEGGERSFALAEVEALDVEGGRDGVDEEEAEDSPIDIDEVIDVNPEEACQEAHSHHYSEIRYLCMSNFAAI